jgi:hypothetical protein
MSATVVTAIQLDISTATGGASVTGATGASSTGVFAVDFGDINGLGVGMPKSGVSVRADANGAYYTTPITLTPKFSGFATNVGAVTVTRDESVGNQAGNAATREGATANSVVEVGALVPTIVGTAENNTPITRHVGFHVPSGNGAGASGPLQSRLVYQLTVP